MPIYTQTQLQSDINGKIKGKIGILVDAQSTMNQGVREAIADIDFLTMRRRVQLTPNLFQGLFEYLCPTDLKGYSIITVQDQIFGRARPWSLVPYEQFMRRQDANTIAVSDYDFIRKVFLNTVKRNGYGPSPTGASGLNDGTILPNASVVIANMDSLTSGGGTWEPFGDVSVGAVYQDQDNFVEGNGSIRFDINANAGTTAGIQNNALAASDLSTFFNQNGSFFYWAYIASPTNLTSYTLRLGSDSSNYKYQAVTSQFDSTAFVTGWNLLQFNALNLQTQGSPVLTAITHAALFMTKTTGKVSETGYRFDILQARRGQVNNLYYYSSYGWQSSGGTWKENSTAPSDVLNVGSEEYQIILSKCAELAAGEVDEQRVEDKEEKRYEKLKKIYMQANPSEALIMISTVADFVKV